MTNADKPSVLIVGAGAIGAFYGSVLARQGARVSVVCRSDYEAVKRGGFSIESFQFGEYVFQPERVLRDVSESGTPPDYLILAVKVLGDEDRAALIRPAVGPSTVIVLLQNGIEIEPEIVQAFPQNEVLSCLAFVGVSRVGSGRISHQLYGQLMLGKYPAGVTPAATRLGQLWEAGGITCRVVDNVVTARWQKAIWNAPFNSISIMGNALTTEEMLSSRDAEDLIRNVMREVCDVAATHGHTFAPEVIDNFIKNTRSMPPYKTSMALDYENNRPMETEAIIGNVVRAGRSANVPIPHLETIYAIVKMIEHRVRNNN